MCTKFCAQSSAQLGQLRFRCSGEFSALIAAALGPNDKHNYQDTVDGRAGKHFSQFVKGGYFNAENVSMGGLFLRENHGMQGEREKYKPKRNRTSMRE
jgi:hypothetical protein